MILSDLGQTSTIIPKMMATIPPNANVKTAMVPPPSLLKYNDYINFSLVNHYQNLLKRHKE